jgi:transposase-like protein
MVHLMRNSLRYVSHKHMKEVATDLKAIYSASTEAEAEFNLELFAEKWDAFYPTISKSWRAHWARVIPLFAFPEDIRKVIYTTNAIESVNMTLRKVTRNHRIFPSDEAVYKVVYLAMRNISVACGRCPSVTGSPHSIGLQWNSRSGFRDEQAVGRVHIPRAVLVGGHGYADVLYRSCLPA